MAQRRQADGEQYIEADNGFGWVAERCPVVLSVQPYMWTACIFGLRYRLVKFKSPEGWCLYLGDDVNPHFCGEPCADTLMAAIDEASRRIAGAGLRGKGYEGRVR